MSKNHPQSCSTRRSLGAHTAPSLKDRHVLDNVFKTLGLPVGPVEPEPLADAYRRARKTWFLRQYDPEYMIEAREQLHKIDEAYRMLRDTRRQAAIVRGMTSDRRIDWQKSNQDAEDVTQTPVMEPIPPAVNRSKVVRQLLKEAEEIVASTKGQLTESHCSTLRRQAYDLGLSFADAEDVVQRITERVATKRTDDTNPDPLIHPTY